jgi:large exoprotein involved in heme utilization and adhesion
LSDILFALQFQAGAIVTVQDAGGGTPSNFVYDGFFSWIKIQNVYTVTELSQRDAFVALRGDVIRVENENGMTDHLTYTGEEWIPYQDIYSLADLSERNSLTDLEKGDVAKVADSGDGNTRSFIYDGESWVEFYMTGNAGTISIRADGDVTLHDDATLTTASTGGINAGEIDLDVFGLQLRDDASVSSASESIGDAGTIAINAEATVTLENNAALTTSTSGQGKGGDISLETSGLGIKDAAYISASSNANGNSGDAGRISMSADDDLTMTDQSSVRTSSEGIGNAGDISISLARLRVEDGASVSSGSNASENGGAAGTIRISARDSIHLSANSSLTTKAVNTVILDESADQLNGKISLYAGNLLDISDSEITTSVQSGLGNGGDITITSPHVTETGQTAGAESVTLNHGKIVANAYEGRGGNIHIVTDQFIQSSDSIVDASSALGIDGTIRIEAPDEDVSMGLTLLPENFLDATRWMKTPCATRIGQRVSRFFLVGRDATPTSPDDLQPSPLLGARASGSEEAISQVYFRSPCPCFAFRDDTEKKQGLMLPSD